MRTLRNIVLAMAVLPVLAEMACAQMSDQNLPSDEIVDRLASKKAEHEYDGPPEDDPSWTETLTPVSRKKSKMIGGDRAGEGEWPFLGTLRGTRGNYITHFCGVTAIAKRWILTAAHCVEPVSKTNSGKWYHADYGSMEILMSTHDLAEAAESNVYGVETIVIHRAYIPFRTGVTPNTWQGPANDIALIELDRDWFGPIMRLSAGGDSDTDLYFGRGFAAGFGKLATGPNGIEEFAYSGSTRTGRAGSQHLMHAMLPLKSPDYCADRLGAHGFDAGSQLCAAFDVGGIDACEGDSGGPLAALDHKGRAYQIGVVSYGDGCAGKGRPGAYARVSHFKPWVLKHVPDAIFINAKPETALQVSQESLTAIVGLLEPTGAAIDINISPSAKLKVNDEVFIEVTSSVEGRLWIMDKTEEGMITPLYPAPDTDIADTIVKAGKTIRLPNSDEMLTFTAGIAEESVDMELNELIVLVLPASFELVGDGFPRLTKSLEAKPKRLDYAQRLRGQITKAVEASGGEGDSWAAARLPYEISR